MVLAKLLLELKMGLKPKYMPHAPDLPSMLNGCDAAVIIVDRALKVSPEEYDVTDLAEAWIGGSRGLLYLPFGLAGRIHRCLLISWPYFSRQRSMA